MKSFLIPILLLLFNTLSAQINLQIDPSRTSGVAPLYVFFDATATTGLTGDNDLAISDFSWNFDVNDTDSNGSWEQTKGMVAGHVFETPGTYDITCTLIAPDGTTDTETVIITVSEFSGTTYYVANTGDDSNDGLSPATPWATANLALNQLSPNERILFNRGDTFTEVAANINNLSGNPMVVGAYGNGDAPILIGTTSQRVFSVNTTTDIRFMDLHIMVTGSGNNTRGLSVEDLSSDVLALRLEIEGTSSIAIYQDESDLLGVFDCDLHDFGVLGIYSGDSQRLSWVGTTMDNLIGTIQPEHGMRIQAGEKQFIAHNSLTNLVDTKTAITIRGDGQQHVMIYDNKLDRVLQVAPTSHQVVQAISHVTIEGNYIGHNADYTGSNFEQTSNGIVIEATRVAVRNNVIDGYSRAINVRIQNIGVQAGLVDIYHNTANWRSVSPGSGTVGRLVLAQDAFDITVRNNLISAPTIEQAIIYQESNTTGAIVSDNVATISPEYITDPLPDSAADTNDIDNYQVASNSPAVDAGTNDVPVFFDQHAELRPSGTDKDVGAFEYSQATNPLANLPALGTGLAANEYFLGHHIFTNAMKSARWRNVDAWDENGFPTAGQSVVARVGVSYGATLPDGEYVLTWEGDGEVIFYNSSWTLVSEDLTSSPKRRVYDVTTDDSGIGVRYLSFPATNVKLWIPGYENHPSLWNPEYLCYMEGLQDGVLRMMDLNETNHSEQTTWNSRTPRHWSTYINNNNNSTDYDVVGAVSYEAMIELCNEMNSDMWVCVPHLADDTYIANLAHLIKTGVDLETGEQTTQPLHPDLKVWVEYSNEVWNYNFAQSHYVFNNLSGDNLDEKYAFKSADIFELFRNQFTDNGRVIRVIATQTASGNRAFRRLNALQRDQYDVLAITTYFRFDYHSYIYDNWNSGALTHEMFYNHLDNQMGTGVFQEDETVGAGRGTAISYNVAADLDVPVVSYEGNEHLNPNRQVDTDADGAADTELGAAIPETIDWLHGFARSDFMYDLLEQYQLRHEASGLQTHVPFVAVRGWGDNGQWGFAEYIGQPMEEATKYRWLHDHYNLPYPSTTCSTVIPLSTTSDVLSFKATATATTIQLSWSINGYFDKDGFYVQKSADGVHWETLGFVPAHSATNTYEFIDQYPFINSNFYRLEMKDDNERGNFSNIEVVTLNKKERLRIYPNPFQETIQVEGTLEDSKFDVFDVTGKLIATVRTTSDSTTIDLSELEKGIYFIQQKNKDSGIVGSYKIVKL